MAASIATILNDCLKDLTDSTSSGILAKFQDEVSQRRWLDELGRLRVWAANIGAHQTGQSSLEYRLRDSSHLKRETIKILQRTLQILRNLREIIDEGEGGLDEEGDFEGDSDIENETEENEMSDVQMIYQSLRNNINLLFQISMAIRKPADHDRLVGMKIKNASFFEPWAEQHICHKFPDAEDITIHRLSAAMARQKAVLKYFERHRAKLGKGLLDQGDTESNLLSETVATEMALADDMDHLHFLETNSTSGISQTSYASSLFSGNESLSIPSAPKESADKAPFECPYCRLVITIKNSKDWARHVFRDLMPYVCLSPNCNTPSKLYESRRQWYHHMCEAHSILENGSNCPLCLVDIQPPLAFERHVGHHLEQLALFVLPRIEPEDEVSCADSVEAASTQTFEDSSESDDIAEIQIESSVPTVSLNGRNIDDLLSSTSPRITERGRERRDFLSEEVNILEAAQVEGNSRGRFRKRDLRPAVRGGSKSPQPAESTFVEGSFIEHQSSYTREEERPERIHTLDSGISQNNFAYIQDSHLKSQLSRKQGLSRNRLASTAPELSTTTQFGSSPLVLVQNAFSYTTPREQFEREHSEIAAEPARFSDMRAQTNRVHKSQPYERRRNRESTSEEDQEEYSPRLEVTSGKARSDDIDPADFYTPLTTSTGIPTLEGLFYSQEAHIESNNIPPSFTKVTGVPPKGILRRPMDSVPEDTNPVREGVAPIEDSTKTEIPPGARWTRIDRSIVNPEALRAGNERFEERSDCVIVLRVLTKDEIQTYAEKTREIRDIRSREYLKGTLDAVLRRDREST